MFNCIKGHCPRAERVCGSYNYRQQIHAPAAVTTVKTELSTAEAVDDPREGVSKVVQSSSLAVISRSCMRMPNLHNLRTRKCSIQLVSFSLKFLEEPKIPRYAFETLVET